MCDFNWFGIWITYYCHDDHIAIMKKRLRLINDDKQTDDDDNHGGDDDDGDAETASISKLSTETKWYTHESTWHHGFSWLFTLVLLVTLPPRHK